MGDMLLLSEMKLVPDDMSWLASLRWQNTVCFNDTSSRAFHPLFLSLPPFLILFFIASTSIDLNPCGCLCKFIVESIKHLALLETCPSGELQRAKKQYSCRAACNGKAFFLQTPPQSRFWCNGSLSHTYTLTHSCSSFIEFVLVTTTQQS